MSLFSWRKKNRLSENKVRRDSRRLGRFLRVEELEDRRLLSVSPLETPLGTIWEPVDETPTAAYSMAANPEAEAPVPASLAETISARLTAAGQSPSNLTEGYIFNLNSCPGSTYTIYLDFNGHTTTGTQWNTDKKLTEIVTPVYDTDGNAATFSNAELLEIYEIWLRVSEDYMPFGVNVTTAEPTAGALAKADSTDTAYGIRCCMGGTYQDWLGESAGGIAYIGSFDWNSDTPCFAFQSNVKSIAEAASHEVGHTLGLSHDGSSIISGQREYYQGANGWAPIMGAGYYQPLTQWSRGEYAGATNFEDDLAIITSNGFTYRADDHGDTLDNATVLTAAVSGTLASGIIEQSSDVDCFQLTLNGEQTRLVIGGIEGITNLDVTVSLYDSAQTLLKTFNPTAWTNVVIDISGFTAGTYYLSVAGAGLGLDGQTIYTDYASLGAYTIVADAAGAYGDVPNTIARAAEFDWNGIDGSHTDVIGNSVSTLSGNTTYYYDVDMYRIDVSALDVNQNYMISFTETATTKTSKCLRIFDAAGNELFIQQSSGDINGYIFTPTAAGTYYIGASYYGTSNYTPTQETGICTNFAPFEASVSVVRPSLTNELARVTLSTDSPKRGETLTAYLNPSAATASWRWYRVDSNDNATLISGAAGSSYTVTSDDNGYKIRVEAIGTGDYSGTVTATSANAAYDPTRVTTLNCASTATDGVVSLQEAIATALEGTFGTTVTFDAALAGETIILDGWAIDLTGQITIDASALWNRTTNAPGITISGDNVSQVFTVEGNTVDTPVSLIGLTLTGGSSTGYGGNIWNNGFLSLTDCVVADGTAAYSGGGLYNSGTLSVTDCTVSGNKTTSTQYVAYGGGIYNSGTLNITGGTITGNTTTQRGGGIYNDTAGTLTVTGCEISNGTSVYSGGGIYNAGGATLTECAVSENETTSTQYVADGAGIYNTGVATIIGGAVSGNTTTQNGGGLSNSAGTLNVTGCVISGNSAGQNGGGLSNSEGTLNVTGCTISGNSATQYGAGLYNFANTDLTASLTVISSLIYDNTTTSYGGGICNWGYSSTSLANVTLRNVTLTKNSAANGGGYTNLGSADTGTFYNSIIVLNTATSSGNADVFNNNSSTTAGYNNLSSFNGWNAATSGNNLSYNANDALFADAENGDYRLAVNSVAINTGNNAYVLSEMTTDVADNPRVDSEKVDLGAYEYVIAPVEILTRLTDAFDSANYLIDDGTAAAWHCGEAVSQQASISILQNEQGEAKLILQAEASSNLRWKFNEADAGTFWSAINGSDAGGTISTILTWKTNAAPTRSFTLTVWEDIYLDRICNVGEGSRTLTVNVEWANMTLCVASPNLTKDGPANFTYNGTTAADLDAPDKFLVDAGHVFWDNSASAALTGALTANALVTTRSGYTVDTLANSVWGYSFNWAEFAATYTTLGGGFMKVGTITATGIFGPDTSTSAIYKTFTVTKLSSFIDMLEYTDGMRVEPGIYSMNGVNGNPSHQCTDVALAAFDWAGVDHGITVYQTDLALPTNYVTQALSATGQDLTDFQNNAAYFYDVIITQNRDTVPYSGYSPMNIGKTLTGDSAAVRGVFTQSASNAPQVSPAAVSAPILLIDRISVTTNALSVDLAWESITGATSYTVAWREVGGEWSSANQSTATNPSATVSGLAASRSYEFRVQATDGTNLSDWSQTVTCFSQETVTVTTRDDTVSALDGVVSLREALSGYTDGQNAYYASTILFDTTVFTAANSTITLAGTELTINRSLTIDASANRGAGVSVTINANANAGDARRVILVDDGDSAVNSTVVLNGLTITGGYVVGDGGGVLNQETLTITNCVISGNEAAGSTTVITQVSKDEGNRTESPIQVEKFISGGGGVYSNGAAITITGSLFSDNIACEGGGGLCVSSGLLTLTDSEFRDNAVKNSYFEDTQYSFFYRRYWDNFGNARGGGVHIGRLATGEISGTLFTENTVRGWFSQGAGLYIDEHRNSTGYFSNDTEATLTVDSCTFTSNESVGDSIYSYDVSGGGIYANHSRYSSVTNCQVADNLAISCRLDANGQRIANNDSGSVSVEDGGGGGVYNDGTMDITGCTITRNELSMRTYGGVRTNGNGIGTRFGGGGICGISGYTNIDNCMITDNVVSAYSTIANSLLGGGGVVNMTNALTMTNTLIADNHVYDYVSGSQATGYLGGGMAVLGPAAMTNCTITNNSALLGAGIYVRTIYATASLTSNNSIIAGNSGGADVARYASESLIAYNTLSTYTAWTSGSSNLTYNASSLFVDAPNGDYRLKADSLAVDAGNNAYVVTGETTDLAHQRRVINNTIDIGAYEYVYTRTVTTNSATGDGSLAKAVTEIETGGTILFDKELARTTVTLDASTEITLDKAVTLDASNCLDANGNATVTIAGNNARLFTVSAGTADSPVEIVGLILSGGNGTGAVSANNGNGGAILVETGKALKMTDCTVRSNTATGYGGAVYLKTGAELTVAGTRFESNTATGNNGGAIFADETSALTITDATFTGNSAKNGGALCVYGTAMLGSKETADKVVFGSETATDKNSVTGNGGAIFGYGTITATNVEFLNNAAGKTGGAVYNTTRQIKDGQGVVTSTVRGNVTLTNVVFRGNTADVNGNSSADFGHGGALGNWGIMTITDCTFDNNTARRGGGAIVNGNSNLNEYPTTLTIVNSTFTRNSALIGGAVNNIGTLTLTGCTFGGTDSETGNSLGNSATKNGGALCNGTSGTLNFVDTTKATTFLNNTAGNWGGGMITAGTIGFPQGNTNKPYFAGNTAGAGSDFGNAIANGNSAYTQSANYFAYADSTQTVYQYGGEASQASSGLLPLAAPQTGDTLLLDLDGSGNFTSYESYSIKALGLDAGLTTIAFQYRDEENTVLAEGVLNLTVFVQSPTITVCGESLADGRILKLMFDLRFENDRTVSRWIVRWGDGTSTTSNSMARTLNSVHCYVPQANDAEYSVYLELIDTDGFGEGTTYLVARHTVLGIGPGAEVESFAPTALESCAVSAVLANEKPLTASLLPEKARFASGEKSPLPQPLDEKNETFDSTLRPYKALPRSAYDVAWADDEFSLAESDFDRQDTDDSTPLRSGELLESVWGEIF